MRIEISSYRLILCVYARNISIKDDTGTILQMHDVDDVQYKMGRNRTYRENINLIALVGIRLMAK